MSCHEGVNLEAFVHGVRNKNATKVVQAVHEMGDIIENTGLVGTSEFVKLDTLETILETFLNLERHVLKRVSCGR